MRSPGCGSWLRALGRRPARHLLAVAEIAIRPQPITAVSPVEDQQAVGQLSQQPSGWPGLIIGVDRTLAHHPADFSS